MFLLALFIAMGTTLFSCQDKDGKKQKIDKVQVVDDSLTKKMATGGAMAVKKIDCTQNPPPPDPPTKDSQEDPKIPYSSMVTGEIATVDPNDTVNETIDYDALFNTAYLDVLPFPDGGMNTFYSLIRDNYKVPNKTTEEVVRKVYVSFVIEKDGTLSTIKIIRDAGPETGEEAIRVLKLSPKWTPGKLNNHVVRSMFTLPISFKQ
jgi:hypothetical protein